MDVNGVNGGPNEIDNGVAPIQGRPALPARIEAIRTAGLGARLLEYRTLVSQHRRLRYLGRAAVVAALVWLVLALLYYFNKAVPGALFLGLGVTILSVLFAVLLVEMRKPTEAETARTLDALLDDRQRVVTSIELLAEQSRIEKEKAAGNMSALSAQRSPVIGAQLASTARMLDNVEPRALYPARVPTGQLVIAGALLVLSIGLWLLRSASDDLAVASGGLPPSKNTTQSVATATALAGLPDSQQNQSAQNEQSPAEATAQAEANGSGTDGTQSGSGGGTASTGGTSSQLSPQEAQQQADASRETEKSLQRLAQALDGQGVTQDVTDDIRKGDYKGAGDSLADLGANNDQLSQDAKDSLAQSLDAAADDSGSTPALQQAERNAAQALRSGDYNTTKQALEDLGQAIKDAGNSVIPQQQLAQSFPTPQSGDQSQSQGSQSGTQGAQSQPTASSQQAQGDQSQQAQGDQSQAGDQGQQGSGGLPDPNSGDSSSPEDGSSSGSSGGTSEAGGQDSTDPSSQGVGAGNPGLPGEGSKVEGALGQSIDAAGNPFDIQGNDTPYPNAVKPGDGQPSDMTLDTTPGGSGSASSPSTGGPVDATGESTAPPVGRWGIIQKYFSQDGGQ